MPLRIDKCQRLEPRARDRDLQNGFAARLHDPLWLLARQWQMGEHQGENATSPVRVNYTVSRTPINSFGGNPALDPKKIPAEPIVESERDDWWTMGRRIRAGARLEGLPEIVDAKGVRFTDPPPPYGTFVGHLDGRAVWRARERLGVPASAFGDDTPPDESAGAWDSFRLNYHGRFESGEGALVVSDHHGGPMDWYSGDGDPASATGSAEPVSARAIPTPLEYPGAPHSRFWEIEDARVDIGGYPPDSAHFATMLLVDLVYSHGDDWFMFPVAGRSGSIVTIRSLEVVDSFGRHYSSEARLADNSPLYPGLHPPADFSLFLCKGLTPEFARAVADGGGAARERPARARSIRDG